VPLAGQSTAGSDSSGKETVMVPTIFDVVSEGPVSSSLERPQLPWYDNEYQYAWLTLTLYYNLIFADSCIRAGVIEEHRIDPCKTQFWARDADGNLVKCIDWDFEARTKFTQAFQRGEIIWDWQFMLRTPDDYDGFDYRTMRGEGWYVRPNVICRCKLVPKADGAQIKVVRLDPEIPEAYGGYKTFRSHNNLLRFTDVWSPVLGHELGHLLGLPHIRDLLGDEPCIADAKRRIFPDRCYGETPAEKANIMGDGKDLWPINAKPWIDRIVAHTQIPGKTWEPSLARFDPIPPRKIPLGVAEVGLPSQF
jgi:hypothetical protein